MPVKRRINKRGEALCEDAEKWLRGEPCGFFEFKDAGQARHCENLVEQSPAGPRLGHQPAAVAVTAYRPRRRVYAALVKQTAEGNVFMIGLAHDDQDARACGFPSIAAQLQASAIAISLLPDDAEIRLVPRIRGSIPAPVLQEDKVIPTASDRQVFSEMSFTDQGKFFTAGNMNRRKYERLEDIGWVKAFQSTSATANIKSASPASSSSRCVRMDEFTSHPERFEEFKFQKAAQAVDFARGLHIEDPNQSGGLQKMR